MSLKSAKNLQFLNLRENLLLEIPSEINDLTSLKTLILDNQQISCIPDLSKLVSLHYFSACFNCLIEIPNFENSENLSHLDLSFNFIQKIPNSISSLKNVKTLKLFGNKFPPHINTSLSSLTSNQITPSFLESLLHCEPLQVKTTNKTELKLDTNFYGE